MLNCSTAEPPRHPPPSFFFNFLFIYDSHTHREREEEIRHVRKMETCNIHEMHVHLDFVQVEVEDTTGMMRELEKPGREGKDLVG